eukprot:TRINITY_DN27436_c0_g1_i1.p1 TRINITY_DN27436_c0_g1~~TRINITY_DN27436_c0_g1_i1.p1  ORF type:complete len:389 (+),score=47.20 TRINITY_DN27436_c0_g1_i1:20-1186(+)
MRRLLVFLLHAVTTHALFLPVGSFNCSAGIVTTRSVFVGERNDGVEISAFMELPKAIPGTTGLTQRHQFCRLSYVNGTAMSTRLKIRQLDQDKWTHKHHPWLSHAQCIGKCKFSSKSSSSKHLITALAAQHLNLEIKLAPDCAVVVPHTVIINVPIGQIPPANAVAVCAAPFFGQPAWLVQWLAFHHRAGVSEVVLYQTGPINTTIPVMSPPNMTVSIVAWAARLPTGDLKTDPSSQREQQVGYYSQALAYNDCSFRVKARASWLIVADLDSMVFALRHIEQAQWLSRMLEREHGHIQLPLFNLCSRQCVYEGRNNNCRQQPWQCCSRGFVRNSKTIIDLRVYRTSDSGSIMVHDAPQGQVKHTVNGWVHLHLVNMGKGWSMCSERLA